MKRAAVVAGWLGSAGVATAADPVYVPPPTPEPIDATGLLLRLVAMTVAGMALCFGVWWYSRRTRAAKQVRSVGRLVHKGTLALDRRAAVHLIEVDGQQVAVTTDATGIRSLAALSEPFEAVLARTAGRDAA